jgi:hypothetical protein
MPVNKSQMVDLEEGLDEVHISQVRFGRNRFLRNAALALFGAAAGVFAVPPEQAEAAPPGCHGAPACNTCYDGCRCHRCRRRAHSCKGGTTHCWRTRYNGRCIRCCDFISASGTLCICRCYC